MKDGARRSMSMYEAQKNGQDEWEGVGLCVLSVHAREEGWDSFSLSFGVAGNPDFL